MSRPMISAATRQQWKRHPMLRPGIAFSADQQRAILAALQYGDVLHAQRMVVAMLQKEIDGPRTVARWRNGRKILRAVA